LDEGGRRRRMMMMMMMCDGNDVMVYMQGDVFLNVVFCILAFLHLWLASLTLGMRGAGEGKAGFIVYN
jgi:hypothetical protein